MDKSILKVVHETARDLHDASVMEDVTRRDFDALCLPSVKAYTAVQIKRLRVTSKASPGALLRE